MKNGRVFERDYVPIFIGDEYHGHLWQYWEITERKQAEEELRKHATTDTLTGLLNRRTALLAVEQELARFRRSGSCSVLLMLDVDHFKHINDTYGHSAGDEALRQLAVTIRKVVREADVVGRIGGEEFTILLPDTPLSGAELVAERLRAEIETLQIQGCGCRFGFTVSIGGAALAEQDGSVSSLMRRADEALYEAKLAGRNRVVFSH